ncbi:hypothetical protein L1887_03120 [Cichorium endivia]|nr:hypothetical protein L1887_03120 [Cichorium endivia]
MLLFARCPSPPKSHRLGSLVRTLGRFVSALNEAVPGSVISIFKAWEQRLTSSEIKSISVVGGDDGTTPSRMTPVIGFLIDKVNLS